MSGKIGYLIVPILVCAAGTAQAGGEPASNTPSSVAIPMLVALIGIGGLIAYRLYHSRSQSNPVSPQRPLYTPPKTDAVDSPTATSTTRSLAPGSVFISYRRDDSADITGRIYDRLIQHFSRDIVFKDVDSIPLGIDFRQHLEGVLSQCRVLLAIIGDQWSGNSVGGGKRRIDDPRDQVRLELEVALTRNIPVIPVLVRHASIPAEDELPQTLQSLAYRNGIYVRPDPDFHSDLDRLIKGIEPHLTR